MKWSDSFQPAVSLPPTWRQVVNPLWWLKDDELPDWRWSDTFKRQPFANFFGKVIGLSCYHRRWENTMDGQNWPPLGFGFAWTHADDHWIPRPWIAWRGTRIELGIGWKSHGGFGINCRAANAPNGVEP